MTLKFAVMTVSDRSFTGERPDASGPALVVEIEKMGWFVRESAIVPDDVSAIQEKLLQWCNKGAVDVVLTTGGTGFSPRDVTPEATIAIIEKETPGLCEAMRAYSLSLTPHAMLSRARAGIIGRTLIVNLPGSPRAAVENFAVIQPILGHAIQLIQGDPNAEKAHNAK